MKSIEEISEFINDITVNNIMTKYDIVGKLWKEYNSNEKEFIIRMNKMIIQYIKDHPNCSDLDLINLFFSDHIPLTEMLSVKFSCLRTYVYLT